MSISGSLNRFISSTQCPYTLECSHPTPHPTHCTLNRFSSEYNSLHHQYTLRRTCTFFLVFLQNITEQCPLPAPSSPPPHHKTVFKQTIRTGILQRHISENSGHILIATTSMGFISIRHLFISSLLSGYSLI